MKGSATTWFYSKRGRKQFDKIKKTPRCKKCEQILCVCKKK